MTRDAPLRNFSPPLRASYLGSRAGQVSARFLRRKSKDSLCRILRIPGSHPPALPPAPGLSIEGNSRAPPPPAAGNSWLWLWLWLKSQALQTKPLSVWGNGKQENTAGQRLQEGRAQAPQLAQGDQSLGGEEKLSRLSRRDGYRPRSSQVKISKRTHMKLEVSC